MAERPDHANAGAPSTAWALDYQRERAELAALRRLHDVARRRYGRDVALDLAMDAVEEARR